MRNNRSFTETEEVFNSEEQPRLRLRTVAEGPGPTRGRAAPGAAAESTAALQILDAAAAPEKERKCCFSCNEIVKFERYCRHSKNQKVSVQC